MTCVWRVVGAVLLVMVIGAGSVRAGGAADEPLASHPEVLQGQLSNGLVYVVRRHASPSGGLTVNLSVRVGTLNENDDGRGSARVVERLMVARAAELAVGQLEGAGVRIDRDLTSAVGFDQTMFSISVSSVDESEAREVLKLMAGMVDGLSVDPMEFDRQRRLVAEQERAAASATLRLNTSLFPRLAPGSRIASRLPAATGAALWSLTAPGVEAFAKKWYVAPAMSVVVVGDVDAGVMVGAVTEAFSRLPVGGVRGTPDAGIGFMRGGLALVESDGELSGDVVELVTLDHRAGAIKTAGVLRAQTVEDLALRALATRLEERTGEGELASGKMTALLAELSTEVRAWLSLSRAAPGTWEPQLRALVAEIRRAVAYGFTPGELEAARRSMIATARGEAQQEATLDGAELALRYSGTVASGSTLMSGGQRAAAMEAIFARGVSEEEVRAALLVRLDPARAATLVLLPEAAERPTNDRVLAVMNEALAAPIAVRATAAPAAVECLVDGVPREGQIRELSMDSESGVVTARLASGVTVHHRKVLNSGGRVTIAVSLAGGLLGGDNSARGPTRAIEALWRSPAGNGRSSAEVRRLLAAKDVRLSGQVADNRVMLMVSAPTAEFETAMQLVHMLLTRPSLEKPAFERWREQMSQMAEVRSMQAGPRSFELMQRALMPAGETRTRLLDAKEAAGIEYEAARSRVESMLTGSALDAAITGEVELKPSLAMAATYLASLAPRAGVSPALDGAAACADAHCSAVEVREAISTPNAEQAAVMAGFRGAESVSNEDGRALSVMAEVLSARLTAELRDRRQLSQGVAVASRPNEMFPGSGQFWALTVCDPERADEVAAAIDAAITEVATRSSDEEILAARARVREQAERDLADAGRWADELASMARRGRTAGDFAGLAAGIGSMDAAAIRERFKLLSSPERRVRVIVVPSTR